MGRSYLLKLLALFTVYLVTGLIGLRIDSISRVATLLWPPTGISLAALLVFGYQMWPAILLAAFAVNLLITESPIIAAGICVGNTLEALVGAYLLKRIVLFRNSLDRVKDVVALIVLAALLSTIVSAGIGAMSGWLGGVVPAASFPFTLIVWWFGDIAGALIIAPILLTWGAVQNISGKYSKVEVAIFIFTFLVGSWFLFVSGRAYFFDVPLQPFLIFPFLLWSCFRFGQRGGTVTTWVLSTIAIYGAMNHTGPFVAETLTLTLFRVQIFMAVIATTSLILGAVVSERNQQEQALIKHKSELEERVRERTEALLKAVQELQENEAKLEKAYMEADKANRAKDLFLATLSHELRTPLTSIFSWAQLLQTGKVDETTTQRGLKKIEDSVRLQEQLINDLLDISRIIMGKISLKISEVDPVSVLNATIDIISPLAAQKSITIEKTIEPSEKIIHADPDRLQQVFSNLLSNSIKFTPPGGMIYLTVESDSKVVRIKIRDTGKGIAPEFLPKLFNRFTQQDDSTIRKFGGLGLGLSIVKSLVDSQNGSVQAESPGEGRGAEFIVTFPVQSKYVTGTTATAAIEMNSLGKPGEKEDISQMIEGLRVLIVEDDPNTLEVLSGILKTFKAQVLDVSSAKAALTALSRFKPQVLISDIAMPDEDGYELIKKIRALPAEQGGGVPAVALTAYVGAEDMKRTLSSGFNVYLSKPIDSKKLLQTVVKLAA